MTCIYIFVQLLVVNLRERSFIWLEFFFWNTEQIFVLLRFFRLFKMVFSRSLFVTGYLSEIFIYNLIMLCQIWFFFFYQLSWSQRPVKQSSCSTRYWTYSTDALMGNYFIIIRGFCLKLDLFAFIFILNTNFNSTFKQLVLILRYRYIAYVTTHWS